MENAGNIIVVEAEDNFKKVHKSIIENPNIDCEALGIYTRIIVLGVKWKLNIKGLSVHLGLSDNKIRKAISLLEKEGYIVRTAVRGDGGKLYGWNYQVLPIPVDESNRSNAGKPTSQKTDTRFNGQHGSPTTRFTDNTENGEDYNNRLNEYIDLKENKTKENNAYLDFVDLAFKEAFETWIEYKKERKQKYSSEKALRTCYKKLIKLSNGNPTLAMEVVEQSIANNWAGLFSVKDNGIHNNNPSINAQPKINLHPDLRILDNEGRLSDGTFLKNGYRYYFSKQKGTYFSIPPTEEPMPKGDNVEYDYTLGWYEYE